METTREELRARLADVKSMYDSLRRGRTEDHPEIRERAAEIDSLRADLDAVTAQLWVTKEQLANRYVDVRDDSELVDVTTDFRGLGVDVRARVDENQATIRRLEEMLERVLQQNRRMERRLDRLQPKRGAKSPEGGDRVVSVDGWHPAAADQLAELRAKQESFKQRYFALTNRSFQAESLGRSTSTEMLQKKAVAFLAEGPRPREDDVRAPRRSGTPGEGQAQHGEVGVLRAYCTEKPQVLPVRTPAGDAGSLGSRRSTTARPRSSSRRSPGSRFASRTDRPASRFRTH